MKTNLINKIVKKLFNLLVHNQSYSLKSKITARGTQNSRLLLGDRRVPLQKWFSSGPLWGGSSRAARFARGAAASRQRARQRLANVTVPNFLYGDPRLSMLLNLERTSEKPRSPVPLCFARETFVSRGCATLCCLFVKPA